jgi:hypothetical protein
MENNEIVLSSNSSTNLKNNKQSIDKLNETITEVIAQSASSQSVPLLNNIINDVKDNDNTSKKTKKNKRRNSLNLDTTFDKKTKYNINVNNFIETSRLFNKIIERLDLLEEECKSLNILNNVLKAENKDISSKLSKMTSKYSNLLKDFDDFKQENLKLQMEVKTVETQLTNLNNDEMNGLATNQLNPTSFANILKSKKDSPISEPMVEIINTFNNYSKQKKSRENNVIIFGLKNISKETASDKVNSLFNKMHIVNIKFNNPVLLVKKGVTNTSPPLRISLENEDTKF